MNAEEQYDKIEALLMELFGNTRVSAETTLELLKNLKEKIDELIDALHADGVE